MGCCWRATADPAKAEVPQRAFRTAQPTEESDQASCLDLQIASYNVLGDGLALCLQSRSTPTQYRQFAYRSALILKEVQTSNVDIIWFQEFNRREVYDPELQKLGYSLFPTELFEAKFVCCLPAYGVAMAYKRDRFEVIEEELHNFDLKDIYNDSSFTRTTDKVIFALFKNIETSQHFIVGCCHIYFLNEAIRYAQAHSLLEKASDFVEKCIKKLELPEGTVLPFILCGDFNAGPTSSAASMFAYETKIKDDEIGEAFWHMPETMKPAKQAKMQQTLGLLEQNKERFMKLLGPLTSTYSLYAAHFTEYSSQRDKYLSQFPPYTLVKGPRIRGVVDHIYINKKFKCNKLLELPDEDDINREGNHALPNSIFPSDHIRVEAKLSLLGTPT